MCASRSFGCTRKMKMFYNRLLLGHIRAVRRSQSVFLIVVFSLVFAFTFYYTSKDGYTMEIRVKDTVMCVKDGVCSTVNNTIQTAEDQDNMPVEVVEQTARIRDKDNTTRVRPTANLKQEAIHLRIMELLSQYRTITNLVDGMFLLLEPIRYTDKYYVIMAAFDALVLDVWSYYKHGGAHSMREDRMWSWQTDDERQLLINCSNIQALRLQRSLGAGGIKTAYLADFNGLSVVVKVKNMKVINKGLDCKDQIKCSIERDVRILNEVILFGGLHHPMFNKLLGFCVHSGFAVPRVTTLPGVVAVYELGRSIYYPQYQHEMTFNETLRHAMAFADFLDYAEHSPFGRLALVDLHPAQFVRVGPHYTLTDMDIANNKEDPLCSVVGTHQKILPGQITKMCVFDNPLSAGNIYEIACVRGKCLNYAQKHNMQRIYELFFVPMFNFAKMPVEFRVDISRLLGAIRWNLPAARLYSQLKTILVRHLKIRTVT